MTYLNINLNLEELTEAVLKSDMNTMMKSLTVTVFNAFMEAERDRHIQAASHERSEERTDYRNGYYERDYLLSVGRISLKVPRTRSGEFKTSLFDRYKRSEKAFVLSLMEMVIQGVSTRRITKIVEQLCGTSVSKSFVSDVLKQLDPEIEAFRERPLTHTRFRYVYVDAMYIKVREDGRVVSKAVYIAQGINDFNKREIIGFMVSEEESEAAWSHFFQSLCRRGLTTPRLIISDAHAGLKKAIKQVMVGASWQRCTFHFMRNLMDVMPKKGTSAERDALKRIFNAGTLAHAELARQEFEAMVNGQAKYDAVLKRLDDGFADATQFFNEPAAYHVNLKTTNSVERLNKELRRRDQVIGIYPNVASATRLMGAVLMDLHESLDPGARSFLRTPNKKKEGQ